MNNKPEQEQDPLSPEPQETKNFAEEAEEIYSETDEMSAAMAGGMDSRDAEIEKLKTELATTKDQALRAIAEAENTRKRLQRERDDVRKYAVADFAKDLLDFSDNFARALKSIPEDAQKDPLIKNVMTGMEAMEKDMLKTMEKHGIKKIEPLGEQFDPNFHEAMFEAPGTGKPGGTIIELIEPGYVLQDRLLRPARVGIAQEDGNKPDSGSHIDTEA